SRHRTRACSSRPLSNSTCHSAPSDRVQPRKIPGLTWFRRRVNRPSQTSPFFADALPCSGSGNGNPICDATENKLLKRVTGIGRPSSPPQYLSSSAARADTLRPRLTSVPVFPPFRQPPTPPGAGRRSRLATQFGRQLVVGVPLGGVEALGLQPQVAGFPPG